MFSLTRSVLALTIFISTCSTEKHYECGPHGRFEYCIDGLPACVIGCHCHPGYYFDTDSKICEPNVKLAHQYRRNYAPEVTPITTPLLTIVTLTTTPTSNLDKKDDEVAKDTDDIGDWLYNQFFKAIETQVINSTNNDKPNKLTRRSGHPQSKKKSKTINHRRKRRKSWKKIGRKGKGKGHSLRKKLLKITEDDSLFDSDSGSTSSTDDSSSSSSQSTSSETSSESETVRDDRNHGHRELIIFNKKPTLPLPSFLFMPHMDTPYYPPIGLPPPPILPMFPMVPVPPMPPFLDLKRIWDQSEKPPETTTSVSSTLPSTTTLTSTTILTSTIEAHVVTPATNNSDDNNASSPPPDAPPGGRTRLKIRNGKRSGRGHGRSRESKSRNALRSKFNKESRNKFMHDLRKEVMRNNQKSLMNQFEDHEHEAESPIMNGLPFSQEAFALAKQMELKEIMDTPPQMKDVDFKYLSELIHRANLNESNKTPPYPVAPKENINEMVNTAQIGRRNYAYNEMPSYVQRIDSTLQKPRNLQTSVSENAFYSNLGRQIASMIRNIDAKAERQVNIEIERTNPPSITHPMLNEYRYPSRSYWERSIRSPLHYFKDEIGYKSLSNEKLFSLENEFENLASTSPSLTLQEIENIINSMNKAHFQIQNRTPPSVQNPSNRRLNINLLPKSENGSMFYTSSYNKPVRSNMLSKVKHVNITQNYNVVNRVLNNKVTTEQSQPSIPPGFWLLDTVKTHLGGTEKNSSLSNTNYVYNMKPTRKLISYDAISTTPGIIPKRRRVEEYLTFLDSVPHRSLLSTTQKTPDIKYSQVINYKSLNYFPASMHMQRPTHPQQIMSFTRAINKPVRDINRRPSYFHHELHHFDYFE